MKVKLGKAKLTALGLLTLLLIGSAALITSSLTYDRSNPRDRSNAYYIRNTVEIDKDISEVYHFIKHRIPEVYQELTHMHTEFTILNADELIEGAEIECIEGDTNDIVHNHYVVTKTIENELIQFESKPSVVTDRKTGKAMMKMNVYVYFDFHALQRNTTSLSQTIVIEMPNPLIKSLIDAIAFFSGNRGEWEEQFKDELVNFKPIIERAKMPMASIDYGESQGKQI